MTVVNLTKAQLRERQAMDWRTVTTPSGFAARRAEFAAYVCKNLLESAERKLTDSLRYLRKRLNENDVVGAFEWGSNPLMDAAHAYVLEKCAEYTCRLDTKLGRGEMTDEQYLRAMLVRCRQEQFSAAQHPLQAGLQVCVEHAKLQAWNHLLRELDGAVRHLNDLAGPGEPPHDFGGLLVHSLATTPDGDLRIIYCRK